MHQLSQLPSNTQERVGTKSKNDLHKAIPKWLKELETISSGTTRYRETSSKISSINRSNALPNQQQGTRAKEKTKTKRAASNQAINA